MIGFTSAGGGKNWIKLLSDVTGNKTVNLITALPGITVSTDDILIAVKSGSNGVNPKQTNGFVVHFDITKTIASNILTTNIASYANGTDTNGNSWTGTATVRYDVYYIDS